MVDVAPSSTDPDRDRPTDNRQRRQERRSPLDKFGRQAWNWTINHQLGSASVPVLGYQCAVSPIAPDATVVGQCSVLLVRGAVQCAVLTAQCSLRAPSTGTMCARMDLYRDRPTDNRQRRHQPSTATIQTDGTRDARGNRSGPGRLRTRHAPAAVCMHIVLLYCSRASSSDECVELSNVQNISSVYFRRFFNATRFAQPPRFLQRDSAFFKRRLVELLNGLFAFR